MFEKQADEAFGEWDRALGEAAPKKPLGPDYGGMLKTMQSDPRVAQKVLEWRRFQHQVNGVEMAEAERLARDEMDQFAKMFGR